MAAHSPRRSVASWLVYCAVVLALVMSAGFGVLSLVAPHLFLASVGVGSDQVGDGARVFAAYAGARELAVAATLVVLLVMRSVRGLATVMLVAAFANVFDVVHALATQDWAQLPGALAVAIIFLAAAVWLYKQPAGHAIG